MYILSLSLSLLHHLTFFLLHFPRYQSLTSLERDLSWLLTLYSLLIHWHFRNEGKPRKYRSPRRCFLCFSVCSEYFSCLMSSSLLHKRRERERFLGVFAWIPTSLSLSFLLLFSLVYRHNAVPLNLSCTLGFLHEKFFTFSSSFPALLIRTQRRDNERETCIDRQRVNWRRKIVLSGKTKMQFPATLVSLVSFSPCFLFS